MKNFTYLILAGFFMFIGLVSVAQPVSFNSAQQKPGRNTQTLGSPQRNCPTFELMEKAFQADPAARLRYSYTQQMLQQQQQQNRINGQNRVQAIINVPVVVHVLLPAAQQALVTDAIIQTQLDTLNFYYGGSPFNSDSLRVYDPFRTTYGRTEIRFCFAQRTPTNLPTNGITRTVTSTIYDGSNTPGNAIVWDPTKYLNIWVVNAGNSGLLGYSYTPGTWSPSDPHQGFVNDYRAFGAGPGTSSGGYHYNEYNQGKTAVHEIGHYFNLAHTWGPNNSGNPTCTLSDFCNDTPPCDGPFFGCPSSVPVLDNCSSTPPGVMWQNHMDYADDRCMVLFTNDQCARMMTAINTAPDRIGLTTSNGCIAPPPPAGLDASISAIISPVSGSSIGCSSVTPVVTIQNLGSTVLTSATINVRLNGSLAATQPWTGSLTQGQTANVTLNSLAIPLGANVIKVHTTLPNGSGDANPGNDTATTNVTRISPLAMPVTHNFNSAFLPTGWSISNPDGTFGWIWANAGQGGSGFSAAIDNYNYDDQGQVDDINTPSIATTGLLANDSVLITFDLAHKNYPDVGFEDSLKIQVSNNCGATWTTIWQKGDPQLATAGSSTGQYFPPAPADWIKQRAAVGNNIFGAGQVQFRIRNVTGFGNVLYVDNINVDLRPRKDMQVTAIVRPALTECAPPFAPSITVRNNGGELVTGFKTGYILNGGAPVIQAQNIPLNSGESTTVTFPNLNAPSGINTIKMFVADPITASPGPDGTPGNDTLTRTFTVPVTAANVVQGFEGAAFVPANWLLLNPNNNATWVRKSPGKSSDFSAFIDNYNNNLVGELDMIQAPPVNTTNADSLVITFDLAHKNYDDGSFIGFDRLRVLASRNCGSTFTSVYSKAGPTLATAGGSADDYTDPVSTDWRRETVGVSSSIVAGSSNILIQFENRNDWGNNIFIDNVNITPIFKRDIELVSLTPEVVCSGAYTPVATVRNRGTEAITAYKVAYRIGTGAIDTTVITGVNLAPGATTTVTLRAGTLAAGTNSIRAYTLQPTTTSGTGDQYTVNDSLSKNVSVAGTVAAPANIVETFEGTFLPTGWAVANPDNALTWEKAGVGKNSTGSAVVRNFVYFTNAQRDALYSPVLTYTGVDSVKLSFDVSATIKDANPSVTDTLEVLVTKDCGATFTSVYKKWGAQLQTIGNANYQQSIEFTPGAHPYLWRKENIDLTAAYASGGPLQVVFRNSTNNQNNVYVDNVNLRTVTLPARLKTEGLLVTPNPFSEQFKLWFVQTPTSLKYVRVLNSAGQTIWNKGFSNVSSNVIDIDLSGKPAGVYIVHVGYTNSGDDREIRIVKAQ